MCGCLKSSEIGYTPRYQQHCYFNWWLTSEHQTSQKGVYFVKSSKQWINACERLKNFVRTNHLSRGACKVALDQLWSMRTANKRGSLRILLPFGANVCFATSPLDPLATDQLAAQQPTFRSVGAFPSIQWCGDHRLHQSSALPRRWTVAKEWAKEWCLTSQLWDTLW